MLIWTGHGFLLTLQKLTEKCRWPYIFNWLKYCIVRLLWFMKFEWEKNIDSMEMFCGKCRPKLIDIDIHKQQTYMLNHETETYTY